MPSPQAVSVRPETAREIRKFLSVEGRGGKKTAEIAALRLLRAGKAQIMHIMGNFMDIFLGVDFMAGQAAGLGLPWAARLCQYHCLY